MTIEIVNEVRKEAKSWERLAKRAESSLNVLRQRDVSPTNSTRREMFLTMREAEKKSAVLREALAILGEGL